MSAPSSACILPQSGGRAISNDGRKLPAPPHPTRSGGRSAIGMLKMLPISVAKSKKIAVLELMPRL
jgi:hypothetical protein